MMRYKIIANFLFHEKILIELYPVENKPLILLTALTVRQMIFITIQNYFCY